MWLNFTDRVFLTAPLGEGGSKRMQNIWGEGGGAGGMGRCLSTSLFKSGFVNSPLGGRGVEARAKHLGGGGGRLGGMFVHHFVQKYICKKLPPRGIELMTFMTVASLLANCASCG